jgi:hypothetical protein
MNNPLLGAGYPDPKLFENLTRFTMNGIYQGDFRPLLEASESNGLRTSITFPAGSSNPWGYSGNTVPMLPQYLVWHFSGQPRSNNKDSGLGQAGKDPAGPLPVHMLVIDYDRSSEPVMSLSDWHKAFDTFGPPGTGAFPYLPPGYVP